MSVMNEIEITNQIANIETRLTVFEHRATELVEDIKQLRQEIKGIKDGVVWLKVRDNHPELT